MQVISFKDTVLYKRGFWLSAVAMVAAVAAPSVVDKSIFNQPVVHIIPICILIVFGVYFLRSGRFFSVADEVIDCGDYLQVRRARTEVKVPFSSISAAEVSTTYRMHRITIHLREQTKLGARVDFWPQASLWGNLFAVQQVAIDLADRARRAVGDNANYHVER
jgi:MFS-type transporter involved in bile tolerance (Atg22 family)